MPKAVGGAAGGEPSEKNPKMTRREERNPESGAGAPGRATAAEQPIPMEIGTLVVDDGRVAFVDRAMKPPFTESISRLRVSIDGLSTTPGRRAKVKAQGKVGADAALEVSGEIAPLGDFYADLAVELRDFALPRVSPYAESAIAWVIERGQLVARVQYKVEGARLTAQNHIVVGDLAVGRAEGFDTAEQRLGLPLGMIVALIKDGQGRIVIDVPVAGTLGDPQFDWSETIWTAVRNVLVNVAAAPFRAIGRLFTRDDNRIEKLSVEPVTFEPGSTSVTADMERHLTKIAEFLRGAPAIALSLAPVVTSDDTDTLRRQALTVRLQNLKVKRKLKDEASAVAAEFRERFPKVTPLPSPDEQFAKLLELEPPAEAQATELGSRRLEAVRDVLLKTDNLAPERLRPADPVSSADTGGGRVEFSITALAR